MKAKLFHKVPEAGNLHIRTCNIDRLCDEPCSDGASTATPAGIELVRKAIERLGHPCTVTYVDIADAFTPKKENGEPCHIDGYEEYLSLGTDITCDCVLQFVLQHCGYTDDGTLGPVRAAKLESGAR